MYVILSYLYLGIAVPVPSKKCNNFNLYKISHLNYLIRPIPICLNKRNKAFYCFVFGYVAFYALFFSV